MADSLITLIILAVTVALFIWDRLPIAVVAMLVPVSLWATGVLSLPEAVAGFGDPTVLFIAALFVVSEALDATGVTAWVGDLALRYAGTSSTRLLVTLMVMMAALTALITPNGSVAALTPVIVAIAVRGKRSPSQLLLPAAFAAHAGSLLMLTGSPVTLVLADYVEDVSGHRVGLFSVALVGAPLLVITIVVALLLGARLVPLRSPRRSLRDFGAHGLLLTSHYGLRPDEPSMGREVGLAEFIVPPRSAYIGDEVYAGMVTESGNLVVAAVHRGDEVRDRQTAPQKAVLCAGDRLLLRGEWSALDLAAEDPGLIAVDLPEDVRRQAVPLGIGAKRALSILGVMVVLLATGLVPPPVAGIAAAIAIILSGALSVERAYQGISWTTIIMVAGMMSLSVAMEHSGAAEQLAHGLVALLGDAGPYALLAGLFVITAALGQLISNMATALIVVPIGLAAAAEMAVSPIPILMAIAVFAAGALLTPVATPANLVVMEAAGYRFGDYWKLGLPLLVCYGLAGIFLVPLIWPL